MEYDPVEKSRVSQESPPKFLRKLLLDFLFDCRHSTLFQQNEHFDQVFQSLQSNLLFRAISAKSDYEYGRNNFQHCNKGDQVRIRHALQLQEAERRWLNVIRAVESPEVFSLSNGWLSEVEEEYARVMFADSEKPKTSAPAYNRRAWQRLLESSQANHPSRQTNTRHLSNLIIKDSVFWFLRRYSLRHALGILLGCTLRRATWLWNGFLTWIAVALITFWASGFFPSPAQKTLLGVALILLLLPPLVFLVLLGYHRIRRTGVLMPEGVVAMLLPRLLIALGSVWITYSVFDGMDSTPLENFYRFLLLQGIALLFVLYSIHRVLSYRKTGFRPLLIRAGGLMLMTLWSGVLTGVLYIDFTHADQLKQVNHLESYFHSIRDELPDRMKDDETKDSVMQIVGPRGKLTYGEKEQLMAALVEVSRDKQDDLRVAFDYEFLWFQFRVYPGTTLHHVCWVVFFGLFFQLLFQEKPVTEPI